MNIRDYPIGIILGAMFIAATSILILNFGTDYGVSSEEGYNNTYNKMDNMQTLSDDIVEKIDTEPFDPTSFWGLVKAPWKALKLVLGSATILKDMIFAFGQSYGIPSFFLWGVSTILVLTISFLIISTLFKRKT
jgi:hypothetical protein